MTGRQKITVAIAGSVALAMGGGLAWRLIPARGGEKASGVSAAATPKSTMRALAEGLSRGDARSLASLCERVLAGAEKPAAVTESEAGDLIAVLDGLRVGFLRYAPVGRASAIAAATHILDRFRVEPAPTPWFGTLKPVHDMILAGLADPNVDVRSTALDEVGRHWNWLPGRPMTPAEEGELAGWKDAFHQPAVRCLGDREPKSRAAAVVCLGSASIDSMAAPAAHYVDDPDNGGVRYKALMTFAGRPNLLTEDAILKRLHDPEPGLPELAELILKNRGLSKEQIFLGRQMYDARPEVRASVIPHLRERTDVDPVVWLLQLSHDADETVRAKAIEALADRESPEVDRRLREMASSDASAAVRAAAVKLVARLTGRSTASLPPLPGSASLNPKAN